MKVKEFIETLVEKNTLIRLWYKVKGGHEEALGLDSPKMEHQILRSNFIDRKVIGITDILYQRSPYIEAVNLIIERGEEDYFETERSNCTICVSNNEVAVCPMCASKDVIWTVYCNDCNEAM